jgi:predicted GNAT family N-acyltransferase
MWTLTASTSYSGRMVTVQPTIVVRRVATAADGAAAYDIRRRVFQEEQGVPPELEFDSDDAIAVHVVAVAGGDVIGTGRLVMHADIAKVGRMAVVREWRGRGAGRAILAALVGEAAQRGVQRVVLHAQVHAIPFYERNGFRVVGDVFDEAGIPHRRMERPPR